MTDHGDEPVKNDRCPNSRVPHTLGAMRFEDLLTAVQHQTEELRELRRAAVQMAICAQLQEDLRRLANENAAPSDNIEACRAQLEQIEANLASFAPPF
jgi:hypothetical protein